MTADKIKNRINELCTHFLFDYGNINCGVDPFSHEDFDMWYGKEYHHAASINEVMTTPLFDGKCLNEIANDRITSEAFAHMFEAQFDVIRHKQMEEYFPKSLQKFESMLGGIIG